MRCWRLSVMVKRETMMKPKLINKQPLKKAVGKNERGLRTDRYSRRERQVCLTVDTSLLPFCSSDLSKRLPLPDGPNAMVEMASIEWRGVAIGV